jgi:uncharacterized protein
MKLLRMLALGVAMAAAPLPTQRIIAHAQTTPSSLEAARELFAIMSGDMVRPLVESITNQTWPLIERDLRSKNPNLDQRASMELRKEFERIYLEFLSDVLKEGPAIYARHFTEPELRALIGFYRSPVGVKLLQVTPQMTAETMQLILPRIQDIIGKTNDAFQRVLRDRGFRL